MGAVVSLPASFSKPRLKDTSYFPRFLAGIFILCMLPIAISGCENKRPPGYLSIGKISEVAQQSGFLKNKQIYLHKDQGGVALMSTLCTFDLSALRLINDEGGEVFVSDYNESRYDIWGHVLRGPARHDLPFYQARVESGVYGGVKDTIYVEIGKEVGRDWRLTMP